MKKPEFKKSYPRTKESGVYGSKSSSRFAEPAEKKVNVPHFEKPVYRGKEDRLAGKRTRNETRVFSGYAPHPAKSSDARAYTKPKNTSPKFEVKSSRPKNGERNSSLPSFPSLVSSGSLRGQATPTTSWGGVADWYNDHLEKNDDTYHTKVVFPNLLRMLGDISGKRVLDMACGQGIFSEKLRDEGAFVTGVDLGKELISIAEEKSKTIKEKGTHKVVYHVGSADDLFMLKNGSFDIVVCILALQNIENLSKTISEARRVLTPSGKLFFVLNHPSFRNPKQTHWGYSESENLQYRRVDEYMSESHVKIDMTPGSMTDKKFTVSFHRPLQVYIKALSKNGLAVTRLEEWMSHRESERGPKKKAEDKSRKEIPLFMCIETVVIGKQA